MGVQRVWVGGRGVKTFFQVLGASLNSLFHSGHFEYTHMPPVLQTGERREHLHAKGCKNGRKWTMYDMCTAPSPPNHANPANVHHLNVFARAKVPFACFSKCQLHTTYGFACADRCARHHETVTQFGLSPPFQFTPMAILYWRGITGT